MFIFAALIACFITISGSFADLHPKNTILSGPGISNRFSLPVQYFYIQPVDENGKK